MEINYYQKEAENTAIYPNKGKNITYPVLGLVGETMEALQKLRISNDLLEWSDCCWYISALTGELGIKLSDVIDALLEETCYE